ncbi:hypothetical protein K469DRAFT_715987 [Zopfia rhizophila CBS 207.26]|uniref:HypA-like protein n=1 Tax=Zopfia rhizophila CBS 207.26 TaxID=1314779 RepID=A0A6A6DK28_9PEZI|nr:hypothetical protein K469DRAFT_715987 [Zopfia rhizophila CBS 207.26]
MLSRATYLRQVPNPTSFPRITLRLSSIQHFGTVRTKLHKRTMVTSSKIQLSPSQQPELYLPGISSETADTASELLQENHEKHHIFFRQDGFHNHIVHHLLTIFALNASPPTLKRQYDLNAIYQRPPSTLDTTIVKDMHLPDRYKTYLGNQKYYNDFLVFFQDEIEKKGWENVLNEYVFKGDDRADDMLVRMFAGFLHPIIHLGFGIEFQQPAIMAEALAQAAVHDAWIGALFYGCEKAAKANSLDRRPTKTLVQLLDEIRADEKLSTAAHWDDGNKIRDGILKRAPEEMIKYASQYLVPEGQLEEKTAEMINAAVYYTGSAQHPPNQVKFDFYYMHCVNASIFFSSFLKQSWLSSANKIRLLEWKVRIDLAMYASRRSPRLNPSEITNYRSKRDSNWTEIFERVKEFEDDGHASKLVRALANGEKACKKFEDKEGFVIKGDMWRLLGNMVIDSVEEGEPVWVRSAGFEEAWEKVPERETARL